MNLFRRDPDPALCDLVAALVASRPGIYGLEVVRTFGLSWRQARRVLDRLVKDGRIVRCEWLPQGDLFPRVAYRAVSGHRTFLVQDPTMPGDIER